MMTRRTVRRSSHTIVKTFPEKEKQKHLKEFCIQQYINEKDPSLSPKIVSCKGSKYKIESDAKTTNLEILLEKHKLSNEEKIGYMSMVRDLIKRLHNIGIKHNDIYPCNVVVDTSVSRCYLIDFEKAEFVLFNKEKNFERDIIMFNNMANKYGVEFGNTYKPPIEPDFKRYKYMRNEDININSDEFEKLLEYNISLNHSLSNEDKDDINVLRVMLLTIILPSKEIYEVASNLNDIDNISDFIKLYNTISKHLTIKINY